MTPKPDLPSPPAPFIFYRDRLYRVTPAGMIAVPPWDPDYFTIYKEAPPRVRHELEK